jgi:hypothetical protein
MSQLNNESAASAGYRNLFFSLLPAKDANLESYILEKKMRGWEGKEGKESWVGVVYMYNVSVHLGGNAEFVYVVFGRA